jgi:hypothetical protein
MQILVKLYMSKPCLSLAVGLATNKAYFAHGVWGSMLDEKTKRGDSSSNLLILG